MPQIQRDRRIAGAAIAVFVIAGAFALSALIPTGESYPDAAVIPFAEWIGALFLWFKNSFTWLTRGVTAVLDLPLRFAMGALAKGYRVTHGDASYLLPRLSWLGICVTAAIVG